MALWSPKKLWKGKDCFIIGGGKSLEHFDFSVLTNELAIGCNDAYQLGEEICDICIFGDTQWFELHEQRLRQFINPVFTIQRDLPEWVWWMKKEEYGFHKDALGYNGNTGSLAINLAMILGAKNIYLLGFDMQLTNGEANWHPNEVDKPSQEHYDRFKSGFAMTATQFRDQWQGVNIYNVTDNSALDNFEKIGCDEFWNERKIG